VIDKRGINYILIEKCNRFARNKSEDNKLVLIRECVREKERENRESV
jgi:hypothetical protein